MKKKPPAAAPLPTPTKEQVDAAMTIISCGMKPLIPLATRVLSTYLRADLNQPVGKPWTASTVMGPYTTSWNQ